MNSKKKQLELKLKDYQRFIITLLIMSIYLYMGAIMDTYIQPTGDGGMLIGISLSMAAAALLFITRFRRIKTKLEENERV